MGTNHDGHFMAGNLIANRMPGKSIKRINALLLIYSSRTKQAKHYTIDRLSNYCERSMKLLISILISALVLLSLMACTALTPNKESSLYTRIGGISVLQSVVAETVDAAVANANTSRSFKDIKLPALKESIVNQLCLLSGGGCEYDGETMKNSHADAKITTAEFELFVQEFREALDRHVGIREKNELLKILAPMKRDIVTSE
jgi:hemoglobin